LNSWPLPIDARLHSAAGGGKFKGLRREEFYEYTAILQQEREFSEYAASNGGGKRIISLSTVIFYDWKGISPRCFFPSSREEKKSTIYEYDIVPPRLKAGAVGSSNQIRRCS